MERESFIFYKSFYESIKELDPLDQAQIYNAIFNYEFNNKRIELKGVCKSIFTLIIPQLDANNKRYENGKKGGRPKTKMKPNDNQNETKDKPNVNVNDNVNDNVNVNDIYKNTHRFKKPTLEEVEAYCKERGNQVSAERFIDFYESKGWKVGNQSMKDWKACVRTWERKDKLTTPNWVGKTYEQDIATKEEQQEMEDLLKEYGDE